MAAHGIAAPPPGRSLFAPALTGGCPPPPLPPSPAEEFNDRILSPELSDGELQRLHGELQHIYQTYCLEESVDKISFDRFIVEEIRNSRSSSSSSAPVCPPTA